MTDDLTLVHTLLVRSAKRALGVDVLPVQGGFEVAEDETHTFYVMELIFNWRVCTSPFTNPFTYDTGYCYVGKGEQTFLRAVGAALVWAREGADGPTGWNKNVMTREWRKHGIPAGGDRQGD